MNSQSTISDPRAKRWGVFAKYAGLLVLGFFVAPYVFTAITGLVGLIAAGAIIGGYWMLMPAVETWAANMRLKLVKNAVASNPVETLNEESRRQSVALDARKAGIAKMDGAIRTLHSTIAQLESEFPDSPELSQMKSDEADLNGLLASRTKDWEDARVSLGEFDREIQRVSRLWDVSIAAAAARQQSGLSEAEWMGKMKTQTAIDTVRNKLNEQLASLNTEKMESDAQQILKGKQAAKSVPINVTPLQAALPSADARNSIPPDDIAAQTPVVNRRKAHL